MTDSVRSPATGPFHAETAEWGPGIYQWQTDDVILGGPDGNDNWPIAALTNRTLWLRQKVEAAETALATHAAGRDHPAATTTQIGFVELATVTESVTGTDTVRAVTPAGLAAALATIPAVPAASDTVAGRVELATVTESVTGTDTTRAVTPAGLAAVLAAVPAVPAASDTIAGRVELATVTETVTGTDTVRAVTPAGLAAAMAAVPPSSVGKHTHSAAAGAILPRVTNGAEPSSVEGGANKGNIRTLLFDSVTVEYGNHLWLPPKSWDRGAITVQFVWEHPAATTNFGVVWGAQAVAIGDGDVMDAAWGALVTVADMGGVAATAYITAESGAVAVAGNPQAGDAVLIQVCRVATDAINDTLAVDAGLIGIRIHYTTAAATDA